VSFVHVHDPRRGKLDPRAKTYVFITYSSTQKGYKYYHPPSKRFYIYISMDVIFNEKESYFNRSYLQGGSSIREDKNKEGFFVYPLDLSPGPRPPISVPSMSISESNMPPETSTTIPDKFAEAAPADTPRGLDGDMRYAKKYKKKKVKVSLNLHKSKRLILNP
jgi:hypothetical protein